MDLTFVLVQPARATNVGAAARALKTMGFRQLVLVDSTLQQNQEAQWTAHGAQDILDNCRIETSLCAVRERYDLLIATTARERDSARHYLAPQQLSDQLQTQTGRCALVFGCEASGLSNEHLALCDLYSYIPMAQSYPSLNLGQAVMVYAYQLSQLANTIGLRPEQPQEAQLQHLKQRVARFMTQFDASKTAKVNEWLQERLGQFSDRDVRLAQQLMGMLERDN